MSAEGVALSIEGLTVDLPSRADRRHAVEDVSLALRHNEILCVVGESGSGKSVMARSILGLSTSRHVQPSAGRIVYSGEDLLKAPPERMRAVRGSRIAMVFQEPMTALNPVLTIGRQIEETIAVHVSCSAKSGDSKYWICSPQCSCPTRRGSTRPTRTKSREDSGKGR